MTAKWSTLSDRTRNCLYAIKLMSLEGNSFFNILYMQNFWAYKMSGTMKCSVFANSNNLQCRLPFNVQSSIAVRRVKDMLLLLFFFETDATIS